MTSAMMIFLVSLNDVSRADLMVWIIGIPLLLAAAAVLCYQLYQHRTVKP